MRCLNDVTLPGARLVEVGPRLEHRLLLSELVKMPYLGLHVEEIASLSEST